MAATIPARATTDGATGGAPPADARVSAAPSFDVADFPVPHGREEEWRFTPLERLRGLPDRTAAPHGRCKGGGARPEGRDVREGGPGRRPARPGRQAGGPDRRAGVQLLREGVR